MERRRKGEVDDGGNVMIALEVAEFRPLVELADQQPVKATLELIAFVVLGTW